MCGLVPEQDGSGPKKKKKSGYHDVTNVSNESYTTQQNTSIIYSSVYKTLYSNTIQRLYLKSKAHFQVSGCFSVPK